MLSCISGIFIRIPSGSFPCSDPLLLMISICGGAIGFDGTILASIWAPPGWLRRTSWIYCCSTALKLSLYAPPWFCWAWISLKNEKVGRLESFSSFFADGSLSSSAILTGAWKESTLLPAGLTWRSLILVSWPLSSWKACAYLFALNDFLCGPLSYLGASCWASW